MVQKNKFAIYFIEVLCYNDKKCGDKPKKGDPL